MQNCHLVLFNDIINTDAPPFVDNIFVPVGPTNRLFSFFAIGKNGCINIIFKNNSIKRYLYTYIFFNAYCK